MKKIFALFLSLFSLVLLFPQTTFADSNQCLQMTGRFTAENWPLKSDGSPNRVRVYCYGDDSRIWPPGTQPGTPDPDRPGYVLGPAACTGAQDLIIPNQTFNLQHCTCPPYADGCFHVEFEDPSIINQYNCSFTSDLGGRNFCGENGQIIPVSFGIGCRAVPTPTPRPNSTPTPTLTPTPTPRPNSTPTPTSPPACFAPAIVPNVQVTCPLCN